jgi:FkbM family methyltransferase
MKETAKDVLRWVSAKLPAGAHASLLEGATTDAWNLLRLAAKKCDVTSVGVTGEYGRIVGSVVDTAVLPIYARTGRFAKRTNDLIASFFNGRDGQYLDVGANIGLTTVPIAQQPQVQCLAIEADPTNFSHLSANVGMNCPHRNVTLRHCAVFNRRGTIDLQLSPDNVGDHRVRVDGQAGVMGEDRWRTVSVPAEPLDALVSSIAHPFVAKVDVQGAEPYVVEGGARVLSEADLLIIEFAPYWLAQLGGDPSVVISFLTRTFDRLSIADGEDAPIGTPQSAGVISERLLQYFTAERSNPHQYLDVIARR